MHIEIDMISRLNSYGNQSYCVKDAVAKKFCLCRKNKLSNLQEGDFYPRKVKYEFVEDHEDEYYDDYKFFTGIVKKNNINKKINKIIQIICFYIMSESQYDILLKYRIV